MLRSRALLNHKIRLLFVMHILFYFLNILTAFGTPWLRVLGACAGASKFHIASALSQENFPSAQERRLRRLLVLYLRIVYPIQWEHAYETSHNYADN
jgi:hypothetical protein